MRRIGSQRLFAPLTLALAVSQALAQQAATEQSATDQSASEKLERVVVTAEKRESLLQDVPAAVTAIGPREIEDRGINSVEDLNSIAPNLQVVRQPGNATASQIAIRGRVTTNPALYWDTAVGIYLDGVYLGKTQGSVFDVVDLQRIEVLRGPQGTLYGRNTLAGAINLITRTPSGKFSGSAGVDVGNYDSLVGKASIDLPQIGIAKIGIGLRSERRDGWVTTTPGSSVGDLNNRHNDGARIAVRAEVTPTFDVDYRYDWGNVDQHSTFSQLVRADVPPLKPYVFTDRQTTVSVNAPSPEKSKTEGHALTLGWNINDTTTLKSITAHRTLKWSDGLDLDGSPLPVAATQRFSDYKQTSQEFQLVGGAGDLNYVAGLYYFEDDGFTNNPQTYFFGTFNFDSRYGFTTKQVAAYGQADYKLTKDLTLTAGGRYTREKKTIDRLLAFNTAIGAPFMTLIPAGTTAEATFSATTPTLALAYRLNPAVNVYGRYAEGFKSGGFNGEYGVADPSPAGVAANVAETKTPFKPERVKSFELGTKNELLDGRALLNVAGFYAKSTDLQLSIFTAQGAAGSVIRNAGKATIYGAEIEGVFLPVDGVRVQLSYGYLRGKYDQFLDAGVDQKDNRAYVHAPRNTLSLGVDARLARTPWGTLKGLADYTFTDSFYLYAYQLATSGPGFDPAKPVAGNTQIKSIGLVNLRLALTDIRIGNAGKGEVALWVRNAADEKRIGNMIDFGPGFGNLTTANFIDPRTYGASFVYRW